MPEIKLPKLEGGVLEQKFPSQEEMDRFNAECQKTHDAARRAKRKNEIKEFSLQLKQAWDQALEKACVDACNEKSCTPEDLEIIYTRPGETYPHAFVLAFGKYVKEVKVIPPDMLATDEASYVWDVRIISVIDKRDSDAERLLKV